MLFNRCILLMRLLLLLLLHLHLQSASPAMLNATVPDPEAVAEDVRRKVEESMHRRRRAMQETGFGSPQSSCSTGNPIDDCWRCDSQWESHRQSLADCAIGFGAGALGGRNGEIYVVTDASDNNAVDPLPGTLRYAVIQEEPLWIVFAGEMTIQLKQELIMNSNKTIDGRGAKVHLTGGCITVQAVQNIIIHGVHIHHCVPKGNTYVRSSPSHWGMRGKTDGDGIGIFAASNIWVDHCTLSQCTDGLIDVVMGSTAITISNCLFSHHNEVMLMGHSDAHKPDKGMQVTIAFNRFGEDLVQRMPRCRLGYFHVVNNDYTEWEMYAIGGSANPTINSQGNRYIAPANPNSKEVTKRVDTKENDWKDWNWKTDGDVLENGAFFVPSGNGLSSQYAKASSLDPKSAGLIDQLTMNAGVLGDSKSDDDGSGSSPVGGSSPDSRSSNGDGGFWGFLLGSAAPPPPRRSFSALLVPLLPLTWEFVH